MNLSDIERFFDSSHLPDHLATVSKKFEAVKDDLLKDFAEDTPFVKEGLLKLIEAKNSFVQAAILAKEQVGELVDDVEGK